MNNGSFLLKGQRVLVFRSIEQSRDLIEKLQIHGADAISIPLLAFEPIHSELEKINAQFLESFTAICFTSSNGVKFFMDAFHAAGLSARNLHHSKIYAVGPQTAAKLQEFGIKVDKIPDEFNAEGIVKSLPKDLSSDSFLLPIAEIAKETLEEGLKNKGARVKVLKIYKTQLLEPDCSIIQDGDWAVFTSPSMVNHYFSLKQTKEKKIVAFSVGPSTTLALKEKWNREIHTAPKPTSEEIINCLIQSKTINRIKI